MAIDFPASPTLNQTLTVGSMTYKWDGTAWNLLPYGTAQGSDAPPSNPQPGTLWFNSKNGALYIWYVDPNSSQWVQIPGVATTAPTEEVLFNGPVTPTTAWKLLNLSAYAIVEIFYDLYPVTTAGAIQLQVSTDNGNTFDAGATAYYYQQLYGTATTTSASSGSTSSINLSSSQNILVGPSNGGNIGNIRLSNFNKAQWLHGLLTSGVQNNSGGAMYIGSQLCGHTGVVARNALQILGTQQFTGRIFAKGIRG